ncbi:MAG: hypothetical protein JJ992_28600, partial [Planctomycetes bacterium]|nr:hypothetical protein [Planctomycetota bacterium]
SHRGTMAEPPLNPVPRYGRNALGQQKRTIYTRGDHAIAVPSVPDHSPPSGESASAHNNGDGESRQRERCSRQGSRGTVCRFPGT